MTIAVYRAFITSSLRGSDWPLHFIHELAQALSAHLSWDIIDSYSPGATPDRYKGDPITDGLWGGLTSSQLGQNSWFIAEQVNPEPGYPAMQIKFQGTGGTVFSDPSGIDYGWNGTNRVMAARLAPQGGWNLADTNPDFANPTKVSRNFQIESTGTRWFFVIDDDFILMPQSWGTSWDNIGCYIGAYNPMTPGQHTPDHPCYMYFGNDASARMLAAYQTNYNSGWYLNDNDYWGSYVYVSCPDETGLMKRWYARCPSFYYFMNLTMNPNEFDTGEGLELLEVLFEGRQIGGQPDSPDNRMIGSHKHIWISRGIGTGAFLGNREYRTLDGDRVCMVIPWDGSEAVETFPF